MPRLTAVTAYLKSKQLLLFVFARSTVDGGPCTSQYMGFYLRGLPRLGQITTFFFALIFRQPFSCYGDLFKLKPLEVVDRQRDPQPQVVENRSYLFNLRPNMYKS